VATPVTNFQGLLPSGPLGVEPPGPGGRHVLLFRQTDLPGSSRQFLPRKAPATGICVTFDTWDNSTTGGKCRSKAVTILPLRIDVRYGGRRAWPFNRWTQAARAILFAEGGPPRRAGPILTDRRRKQRLTSNPGARPCHADGLQLCRCRDRIVRRQYHQRGVGVMWWSSIICPLAYVPIAGGTFAFGARHWWGPMKITGVDKPADLRETTRPDRLVIVRSTDRSNGSTETLSATFSMQLGRNTALHRSVVQQQTWRLPAPISPLIQTPPRDPGHGWKRSTNAQVSNVDGPVPIVSGQCSIDRQWPGVLVQSVSSRGPSG